MRPESGDYPAPTLVSPEEFQRRVIEPSDFVADASAFVDVRLPQSKGKESYSLIGPGVSQNANQTINLVEPHGFNVGAAAMPNGVINNPHLHFTAEVFICTRGEFRFTVGLGDTAATVDVKAGDILSVPTWVFRGFENIGADDGWVFTCLGHDVTGGIIWAPEVLAEAAETGLYLTRDNTLIDTIAGQSMTDADLAPPMSPGDLRALPAYSADELRSRRIRFEDLRWCSPALLSPAEETAGLSMAPVIGRGINQTRDVLPPLADSHGFSMEWIRAEPGTTTGAHAVHASQVLYLVAGSWEIEVNGALSADERLSCRPEVNSVVSLVPGSWREFRNVGTTTATAVLVTAGEDKQPVQWSEDILALALRAGTAVDANGYLAPAHLLPGLANR